MTQAQSLMNITVAALISTAMVGVGLFGRRARDGSPRRTINWLWMIAGLGGTTFAFYVANAELRFGGGGSQFVWVIALSAGGLLVAAGLMRRGFQGRYIGEHPHCRKCGFNLFGRPEGVNRCSECGADLDAKHALVTGVHHRRMGLLLGGVFLLIVSLSMSVGVVRTFAQSGGRFNLNQYKPTWLLLRQGAPASTSNSARQVRDELFRRGMYGQLDRATLDALIASYEKSGDPFLSDVRRPQLVIAAWDRGLYTDADLSEHLLGNFELFPWWGHASGSLTGRSTPQLIVYQPSNSLDRLNMYTRQARVSVTTRLVDVVVDGNPVAATLEIGSDDQSFTGGNAVHKIRFAQPLRLGRHTIRVNYQLTLSISAIGKSPFVQVVNAGLDTVTETVDAAELACPVLSEPIYAYTPIRLNVRLSTDAAGKSSFTIANPLAFDFLGEVFVVPTDGSARQSLGPIFLHGTRPEQVYLTQPLPTDFNLELVPRPEWGHELMRSEETYQSLIRIHYESIDVDSAKS
jgi:hypothetical protein